AIINDAAQAYCGVIPADCWHDPYMPRDYLRHEIDSGVRFCGWEEGGELVGIMGIQDVQDVTLKANPPKISKPAAIRAILMAGADKNPLPSWSRTPTQPLDPQYGVGQLNFDWAYQILTAGPQTASSSGLVGSNGWSCQSLNPRVRAPIGHRPGT